MIVKNRIKKHSEFQNVIQKGEVVKTSFFVFHLLKTELGYSRIGISVSKKTGNAVVRNKIKRQIRACIAMSTDYTKSMDLVIIVRKNYQVSEFKTAKTEIQNILKK